MTYSRHHFAGIMLAAACALGLATGPVAGETLIFNQTAAGTHNWTDTANWADGNAPAATETETVRIWQESTNERTLVLNRMNQVLQGEFQLSVGNATGNRLTFDLDGHTLVNEGNLVTMVNNTNSGGLAIPLTITNGSFQFGTSIGASDLLVGTSRWNGDERTILWTADSVLDATNLDNFDMASHTGNNLRRNVIFDLSAATVNSGATSNALIVNDSINIGRILSISSTNDGLQRGQLLLPGSVTLVQADNVRLGETIVSDVEDSSVGAEGVIDFGGGSTATTLAVANDLSLGFGHQGVGSLDDLPDTFHLTVGTSSVRGGEIRLGYKDRVNASETKQNVEGTINSNGGTFNAWITNLRVGQNTQTEGSSIGTLDMAAAALGTLDVSGGIFVGVGDNATGDLRLNDGTVTADSITVGTAGGTGELHLSGTLSLGAVPTITIGAGGTLDVSAVTGGFTLGAGQTLEGAGTVAGAMTVAGTLSPGTSIGSLTVGDLTLADGAVIEWEFEDSDTYDRLLAAPGTSLTLPAAGTVTLNIRGLGAQDIQPGDRFALYNGTVVNFDAERFNLVNHSDFAAGFRIEAGSLELVAIPEPGALGLLLLGAGLLWRLQRRRG